MNLFTMYLFIFINKYRGFGGFEGFGFPDIYEEGMAYGFWGFRKFVIL